MDLAAELTLWIAQYLHTGVDAPRSALRWVLVPRPRDYTYPEVRTLLSAAEKPLLVGVLHEPGYLGLWRPSALDADERPRVDAHLRSQQVYLDAKLAQRGVPAEGQVIFDGWGDRLVLPVPELRRWSREYSVACGWTLMEPSEPGMRSQLSSGERWMHMRGNDYDGGIRGMVASPSKHAGRRVLGRTTAGADRRVPRTPSSGHAV